MNKITEAKSQINGTQSSAGVAEGLKAWGQNRMDLAAQRANSQVAVGPDIFGTIAPCLAGLGAVGLAAAVGYLSRVQLAWIQPDEMGLWWSVFRQKYKRDDNGNYEIASPGGPFLSSVFGQLERYKKDVRVFTIDLKVDTKSNGKNSIENLLPKDSGIKAITKDNLVYFASATVNIAALTTPELVARLSKDKIGVRGNPLDVDMVRKTIESSGASALVGAISEYYGIHDESYSQQGEGEEKKYLGENIDTLQKNVAGKIQTALTMAFGSKEYGKKAPDDLSDEQKIEMQPIVVQKVNIMLSPSKATQQVLDQIVTASASRRDVKLLLESVNNDPTLAGIIHTNDVARDMSDNGNIGMNVFLGGNGNSSSADAAKVGAVASSSVADAINRALDAREAATNAAKAHRSRRRSS